MIGYFDKYESLYLERRGFCAADGDPNLYELDMGIVGIPGCAYSCVRKLVGGNFIAGHRLTGGHKGLNTLDSQDIPPDKCPTKNLLYYLVNEYLCVPLLAFDYVQINKRLGFEKQSAATNEFCSIGFDESEKTTLAVCGFQKCNENVFFYDMTHNPDFCYLLEAAKLVGRNGAEYYMISAIDINETLVFHKFAVCGSVFLGYCLEMWKNPDPVATAYIDGLFKETFKENYEYRKAAYIKAIDRRYSPAKNMSPASLPGYAKSDKDFLIDNGFITHSKQ